MKEYEIVPGNGGKTNINYYEGGVLVTTELYSQEGFTADIREGYKLKPDTATLGGLKKHLRSLIDEQTKQAIYAGFTFDGVLFSMSENAQINWTNFPFLPEAMFPLSIYGKYDDPYVLSFANKMPFYTAALTHKNTALQTGNSRKGQINACTTVEQVKALAEGWGIVI